MWTLCLVFQDWLDLAGQQLARYWKTKLSQCIGKANVNPELGRGHTSYDIQIIVVILKVTTRFF